MDEHSRDEALAALNEIRRLDRARQKRDGETAVALELMRTQAEAAKGGFLATVALLETAMTELRRAGRAKVANDIQARLNGTLDKAVKVMGHPGTRH
jgi:hypothetical protein